MVGGLTPNPPPAYTTAYMPLKKTPIYLLLHSNRNDKIKRHIAKVNLPLLLHHNQSISRLNKKVGWNRRNVGHFARSKEGEQKAYHFKKEKFSLRL